MQGEQEGRNFFYCADGLGRARGAVTGPEAAAAWPAPPPQAQGHCPPSSWGVSPDGTDRKPGGGQGTVLGALVGLEVRSGHCLEGGPRGAEVGSGSRTCPADCCPHPQSGRWGTGTQRRVLFRLSSAREGCLYPQMLSCDCFKKAQEGRTERREDWSLSLRAKPRSVGDGTGRGRGLRTLFRSLQEGTSSPWGSVSWDGYRGAGFSSKRALVNRVPYFENNAAL